jgi:CubicO group peptidase (beta-lactamase class C family)
MNMTQSQIQSNLITTYASRGLTCLMSAGLALLVLAAVGSRSVASEGHPPAVFRWQTSSPEDQGMVGAKLEDMRKSLADHHTTGLLVIRNDKIVCEWYQTGSGVDRKHYTASMAKAVVGGVSVAVAMTDGLVTLDDPAAQFVSQWRSDRRKSKITIRHLGSHTSGIEDAEADGLPHEKLTGWKGDFWKRLNPPRDAFSISRDAAPVLFEPGEKIQYSNPGIAMLSYCVTTALRDAPHKDIRTLLRERVMRPIGVADADWSVGYGKTYIVDGLPLVAAWGGGDYTARAAARVGRLMLREGDWQGRRLISRRAVKLVTRDAGTPGNCGIGWWSNNDGSYPELPKDAFWGSGAGHQILLVVPSLNLIAVRNGSALETVAAETSQRGNPVRRYLFGPLMEAVTDQDRQRAVGHSVVPDLPTTTNTRLRLIIETDAGGDPDDEQSLVRFLLYSNEWDVEGIIANRPMTRRPENKNPQDSGLGIVRRLLNAYGQCRPNLVQHDARYPTKEYLWQRTVAGYNDTNDAVDLIVAAVDKNDPRPIWYSDWGTDRGAATNNLKRALDMVQRERGSAGYARFKQKLRLSSVDKFDDHTTTIAPPFPIWVNTFQPPIEGKRWYHRFSALTSKAGGFDLVRDVLTGHGPLGALYPTNTTHWAKEGDTMTFLYLVPTGMNDPNEPLWGSWAGRYGHNEGFPGKSYYWANQTDTWNGTTSRDNTLARWAVDLQNDFRARLDWCVKSPHEANHAPRAVVNGIDGKSILYMNAKPGQTLSLDAGLSQDSDEDALTWEWFIYREAGTYKGEVTLANPSSSLALLHVPNDAADKTIHVVLTVRDDGTPPLAAYRRIVVRVNSVSAAQDGETIYHLHHGGLLES